MAAKQGGTAGPYNKEPELYTLLEHSEVFTQLELDLLLHGLGFTGVFGPLAGPGNTTSRKDVVTCLDGLVRRGVVKLEANAFAIQQPWRRMLHAMGSASGLLYIRGAADELPGLFCYPAPGGTLLCSPVAERTGSLRLRQCETEALWDQLVEEGYLPPDLAAPQYTEAVAPKGAGDGGQGEPATLPGHGVIPNDTKTVEHAALWLGTEGPLPEDVLCSVQWLRADGGEGPALLVVRQPLVPALYLAPGHKILEYTPQAARGWLQNVWEEQACFY